MILRPDDKQPSKLTVVFRSKEQQYDFNFPYQCGTAGDGSPSQKNLGHEAFDTEHQIQDYDIIVMASDGVWDNLYDKDV